MVQNEQEYIKFLIQRRGVQENTAKSYVSYLESVSKELEKPIDLSTISSEKDVKSIIKDFLESNFTQKYKNNCSTA